MRILVVTYGFPSAAHAYSGIFVLRQMEALRRLGHELRVLRILPYAPPLRRWNATVSVPRAYTISGIDVEVARVAMPPRLRLLPLVRLQAGRALEGALTRFRADLIHAHTLLHPGYVSVRRSVPTVVTGHGSDVYRTPYRRGDLRRAAQRVVRDADALVGVSGFIRDHLAALGRPDAHVVFNGADEEVFAKRDRAADRAALGIAGDRLVIAFVGGLLRQKGVHELAQAVASIADLQPLLLVGGGGPERAAMEPALRTSGVEARFLGVVPHQTVAQVFGAADVVTLPSFGEGLPSVVCEAMLAGRAVVATPVGGIPEIVRDDVSGRLVPVGDCRALGDALRDLALDRAKRERYGAAAAAFAERHLTWHANALGYHGVYEKVLAHAAHRTVESATRR